MALAFFPRGGSAHVARNLAAALGGAGWDVTRAVRLAHAARASRATRASSMPGSTCARST